MRQRSLTHAVATATVLHLLAAFAASADYPQIRVNQDKTSQKQNEQQIIVNPTDPLNVVACWMDSRFFDNQHAKIGIGYSFDGGVSWADLLLGSDAPFLTSDPVLTVHSDGTCYVIYMEYIGDPLGHRLHVQRSSTGGASWEGPFIVDYADSTVDDKPWIAVDRTGGARDGHLYAAWDEFLPTPLISFARSTDRGTTWSEAVRVQDLIGHVNAWPVPIVLANGNVLVAWDRAQAIGVPCEIVFDLSTNGGLTWGTERILATTATGPFAQLNGGIRVYPYPSLTLDETAGDRAGWVYCVYADRAVSANAMDIWCVRSTDHGMTWSSRARVNDDPLGLARDQFHPWVTCDESGVLHASWYDRRDDPANNLWHIYYSSSSDGGATWATNVRLTTVPSSPDPGSLTQLRAGTVGEYSGIAAREGIVHPIWTDTRNGDQDCFTTVIATPTGVADPIAASPVPLGNRFRIFPNPLRAGEQARLYLPSALAAARVELVHPNGSILRVLTAGSLPAGISPLGTGGYDALGGRLPAGVYLVRAVTGDGADARLVAEAKLVIVP